MQKAQHISRVRRDYNAWVGNETLEDYALRFTAKKSRRWSIAQVGQTALGAASFLALEALAATITLNYGFTNASLAILAVAVTGFFIGFPISVYAARYGLDIDLLTRGAGFGYLGSTVTSLIYASFTFIFFAIEAAILASALNALLGIPPAFGYVLCAVAVIPIVTHGITSISKFQIGTQPIWLVLQCVALVIVAWNEFGQFDAWVQAGPVTSPEDNGFNLVFFGASAAVLFAIVAQIGEQVDYLRFLPVRTAANKRRWWFWLVFTGPGWIVIGAIKMLFGSFLAFLVFSRGATMEQSADPTYMYQTVFSYLGSSPTVALILASLMVIISQMKINVTNAYAGSIAWSNFFSRLTHNHPGRVVWLVFNVTIALILMELGIYKALEAILGVFAIVAVSWLGSLAADLTINKPLGLSPSFVEFKRAHLFDVNPVGLGSLIIASTVGLFCYLGIFGSGARALAHFISLGCCFITVPAIAFATGGRYYLARQSPEIPGPGTGNGDPGCHDAQIDLECCVCENRFEPEDMSSCPLYQGPICSLCCSLDSRCDDQCKTEPGLSEVLLGLLKPMLPGSWYRLLDSWVSRFLTSLLTFSVLLAMLLSLIYMQMDPAPGSETELLRQTLVTIYFIFLLITGVIVWLLLLAGQSQAMAQRESSRQAEQLTREIEAHQATDLALQRAKDHAEQANNAKSRFLTGISHELRTPLQSILGYAQLLERQQDIPVQHHNALQIIRRSGEHLTDLIEGLLDISKIEAGRLDIYRNSVKLRELLDQLVFMFKDQASAKGLSFTFYLHNRLPEMVTTDQRRLRQILINILSNAIKYTSRGSIEFHVRYRNQVAVFSVIDTGVGIKKEDMERILVPFERVRDPGVPRVSGTGLGLTIVHLLTEIMGGDLKIDSVPVKGSTFTVSLMMPWVSAPTEGLPSRQLTGYQGGRKVVMVVDDEPIHRGFMSDLLTPLGFTVIEACDANNCLQLLHEVSPDLFLLDVSMPPGISGLELAEQLRGKGYRQPIVMLSADAQEHHLKEGEWAYHDSYVVKPVNNQKLLECIGSQLDLEWQYVQESPQRVVDPPAGSDVQLTPIPDHSLFRELHAYAQIGYQSGVVNKLVEIENARLVDSDMVKYFKTLSNRMQFTRIVEIIERSVT